MLDLGSRGAWVSRFPLGVGLIFYFKFCNLESSTILSLDLHRIRFKTKNPIISYEISSHIIPTVSKIGSDPVNLIHLIDMSTRLG